VETISKTKIINGTKKIMVHAVANDSKIQENFQINSKNIVITNNFPQVKVCAPVIA
jgi:hypothetical protein